MTNDMTTPAAAGAFGSLSGTLEYAVDKQWSESLFLLGPRPFLMRKMSSPWEVGLTLSRPLESQSCRDARGRLWNSPPGLLRYLSFKPVSLVGRVISSLTPKVFAGVQSA